MVKYTSFEEWLDAKFGEFGGVEEYLEALFLEGAITGDDVLCLMSEAWDDSRSASEQVLKEERDG